MIKRHEVQVLLRSGMSHRQVARHTGVSKRTVTRPRSTWSTISPRSSAASRSRRRSSPDARDRILFLTVVFVHFGRGVLRGEVLHPVQSLYCARPAVDVPVIAWCALSEYVINGLADGWDSVSRRAFTQVARRRRTSASSPHARRAADAGSPGAFGARPAAYGAG
jgi:hypothetical protein